MSKDFFFGAVCTSDGGRVRLPLADRDPVRVTGFKSLPIKSGVFAERGGSGSLLEDGK